jgi:microcystin-dependent protein
VTATTVNTGLFTPGTGDLVGLWGSNALNPNFVSIDGLFGGATTISASNAPIVLTSPSGFTPTPSPGPTQAQNAILRFTGTLTANVQVTLPIPGYYIINNQTTGAFVLSFRAIGSGQVIAVDQQDDVHIYNNGTNVRFVNLGRIGATEMWAGLTALPAWVTACTQQPYLLCDGTVYNFTAYPALAQRLLGKFGGNGISTFAVPDSQGRIQLPYDGTGTRITTAVSNINGQTIGAAGGDQNSQSHTHAFAGNSSGQAFAVSGNLAPVNFGSSGFGGNWINSLNLGGVSTPSGTNSTFGAGASQNVQPSQVTGIMVIRAG